MVSHVFDKQCIDTIGFGVYDKSQLVMATRLVNSITFCVNKLIIVMQNGVQSEFNNSNVKEINLIMIKSNLGCSGVWNIIMSLSTEYAILPNYDVKFLGEPVISDNTIWDYNSNMGRSSLFTCFGLRKTFFLEMGMFNENYWPAYFEDDDVVLKLNKYGQVRRTLPSMIHHGPDGVNQYVSGVSNKLKHLYDENEKWYRMGSIDGPINELHRAQLLLKLNTELVPHNNLVDDDTTRFVYNLFRGKTTRLFLSLGCEEHVAQSNYWKKILMVREINKCGSTSLDWDLMILTWNNFNESGGLSLKKGPTYVFLNTSAFQHQWVQNMTKVGWIITSVGQSVILMS